MVVNFFLGGGGGTYSVLSPYGVSLWRTIGQGGPSLSSTFTMRLGMEHWSNFGKTDGVARLLLLFVTPSYLDLAVIRTPVWQILCISPMWFFIGISTLWGQYKIGNLESLMTFIFFLISKKKILLIREKHENTKSSR